MIPGPVAHIARPALCSMSGMTKQKTLERRATGRVGIFTSEAGTQVGELYRWRIKVIEGDIVGSSNYYPFDVIERDLESALPVGSHVYVDHPTWEEEWDQPERTLTKLAGSVASGVTVDPATKSFYVDVDFSKEAHEKYLVPFSKVIGASIYMMVESIVDTIGDYTGPIATALVPDVMNGVDIVTRPGAKGAIIAQVTESFKALPTSHQTPVDRQRAHETTKEFKMDEETRKAIAEAVTKGITDGVAVIREADSKAAKEAADKAAEAKGDGDDVTEKAIEAGIESATARRAIRESVARGTKLDDAIKAEKDREEEYARAFEAKREREAFGGLGSGGGTSDWTVQGVNL